MLNGVVSPMYNIHVKSEKAKKKQSQKGAANMATLAMIHGILIKIQA